MYDLFALSLTLCSMYVCLIRSSLCLYLGKSVRRLKLYSQVAFPDINVQNSTESSLTKVPYSITQN